ncbi:hypothetical protein TNCV_3902421 [Trichonephila clavipes]|nr:hypothetical protein TNCV_3902421 [Trichonephila clavipes]
MCRVEVLQPYCVCRTTDGCVIAGSRAARAVKSIIWNQYVAGRFATRKDINAVRQQVTRFTHGAPNAEADGIQRLPHRRQHVVTVAGVRYHQRKKKGPPTLSRKLKSMTEDGLKNDEEQEKQRMSLSTSYEVLLENAVRLPTQWEKIMITPY